MISSLEYRYSIISWKLVYIPKSVTPSIQQQNWQSRKLTIFPNYLEGQRFSCRSFIQLTIIGMFTSFKKNKPFVPTKIKFLYDYSVQYFLVWETISKMISRLIHWPSDLSLIHISFICKHAKFDILNDALLTEMHIWADTCHKDKATEID